MSSDVNFYGYIRNNIYWYLMIRFVVIHCEIPIRPRIRTDQIYLDEICFLIKLS
jgi:hypothetical protein